MVPSLSNFSVQGPRSLPSCLTFVAEPEQASRYPREHDVDILWDIVWYSLFEAGMASPCLSQIRAREREVYLSLSLVHTVIAFIRVGPREYFQHRDRSLY